MAIQNTLELEAVLTRVLTKLDRQIAERGTWPLLEDARRTMEQVRGASRNGAKLKEMREKLRSASETIISEVGADGALHDDVWDVEDFVDYHV
ncbi:MAG: hypothetical protein R3B70_33630 [Polyangiaceae bacterium]